MVNQNRGARVIAQLIDPKLLAKITAWHGLTNEMLRLFHTDDIAVANEAADDIVRLVTSPSKAPPKKAPKRKPAKRRAAKTKAKAAPKRVLGGKTGIGGFAAPKAAPAPPARPANEPTTFKERVQVVLGNKVMDSTEILQALAARNWAPKSSTNPKAYVNSTLCGHKDVFVSVTRGRYKVRPKHSLADKAKPATKLPETTTTTT